MRGIQQTYTLPAVLQLVIVVVWLAPILATSVFAAIFHPNDAVATIWMLCLFAISGTLTWLIVRYGKRPSWQIVSPEGLRGSFRHFPLMWWILLGVAITFSCVHLLLVLETPQLGNSLRGWAQIALLTLALVALPIYKLWSTTQRFTIDEQGVLWIHRFGKTLPAPVEQFERVRVSVVQSRRGIAFTRAVLTDGPLRRVVLPFDMIRSERYGTQVYGTVINAYLYEQVQQAGFRIDGSCETGWQATRNGV